MIWMEQRYYSAGCKTDPSGIQDLHDLVAGGMDVEVDRMIADQGLVGEAGGRDFQCMAKVQGATMTCLRLDV